MNLQSSSQPLTPSGAPAHALHRCFYAVRFSAEITSYLASIIAELRRHPTNVRWVPERNIHLTLRFLGEITDQQLEKAIELMQSAPPFRRFTLGARGLGAFPLMRAPRVLWAGVDGETREDTDQLLSIQGHTEQWSRRLGLPPEQRGYSPHITLGRVARPFTGLRELIDDIIARECVSPYCAINEVVLMKSALSGKGAEYGVVGSVQCEG